MLCKSIFTAIQKPKYCLVFEYGRAELPTVDDGSAFHDPAQSQPEEQNVKKKWLVIPALLAVALVGTVAALPVLTPFWLEHRPHPKVVVDGAMRAQAIDVLVTRLNQHYVFPDTAKQVETLLRKRQQEGKYDAISNGEQLAARLTADVASVAHDLHMRVEFSPEPVPPDREQNPAAQTGAGQEKDKDSGFAMRWIDRVGRSMATFGVEKADHLSPTVGYLQVSGFFPPGLAAEKYAAAMDKLADTGALIIDLRDNGGGSPEGVALLISYFVDQRTRLNDIWSRDSGESTQYWTEDKLAGKRYGGKKPVALLVGPGTASAGEDFAYTMQALKRATLIGARTWGGAHPTSPYRLGDHFFALIPNRRSISPITHGNWEGTGVIPDMAAAPANALAVAKDLLQRQTQGAATLGAAD
jgi:hypothetical protein